MRNNGTMKSHFLRKMFLILCSFLMLIFLDSRNVFASKVNREQLPFEAIVDDQSDIFTQEEEEKILQKMRPITAISNVAILTRDTKELSTNKYLQDFHNEHWKGQPSIVCIFDFGEGVLHISRFGDKEEFAQVNDKSLQIIVNEMRKEIDKNDFVKASIVYCKNLSQLLHLDLDHPISIVTEQGYDVIIDDQANLLSDEEKEKLLPNMRKIGAYGHVVFVTTEENDKKAQQYCRDYFDEHWDEGSAVIFLIDMKNRILRIESFGYGQLYDDISVAYANTITDNVYQYAGKKEYFQCANTAFTQINDVLEGKRIAQPMKYISNALLAIIFSVFIIFIYVRRRATQKSPAMDEMLQYIDYYCNVGKVKKHLVNKTRIHTNSHYSSSGSSSSGDWGDSGGSSSSWGSSSSSSSSRGSSSSHSSSSSSHSSRSHGGEHRF